MLSWLALPASAGITVPVHGHFCLFYFCLSGGHLCHHFYKCWEWCFLPGS